MVPNVSMMEVRLARVGTVNAVSVSRLSATPMTHKWVEKMVEINGNAYQRLRLIVAKLAETPPACVHTAVSA